MTEKCIMILEKSLKSLDRKILKKKRRAEAEIYEGDQSELDNGERAIKKGKANE